MTTAVVTGASRGVGRGIARALGAAGYEVYGLFAIEGVEVSASLTG
jgi:NAD(P)-dependent dehydrogenase (short-subunit alcohol dehydrogenase family)